MWSTRASISCRRASRASFSSAVPGIAKGYLKRPELTAEKFIANPFPSDGRDPILYRSGDAVSLDEAGNIAFHGRIDDQVKIRGFRVELGEIETKLVHLPGVAQAAVVLRQDEGMDRLVAFLVLEAGVALDRATIRADLRDELPPYMIPSHFEIVEALPRLSSGKVDRKSLKMAELAVGDAPGEQEEPANETEAALLVAAKRVFGNQAIPFGADFFTDLGGHSLLAARFVSNVREDAGARLDHAPGRLRQALLARDGRRPHREDRRRRRRACRARPLVHAAAADAPLPVRPRPGRGAAGDPDAQHGAVARHLRHLPAARRRRARLPRPQMAALLAVYVVINAVTALIAIALKWVVLGRTKPGRYPLWGVYYFRWWFAKRLEPLVHIKWLQGSPMIRRYLRLMGAQVGGDVIIADIDAGAIDLVSIGRGTTIGSKTKIANVEIIGNEMVIGEVVIGADVYIGSSCTIGHDVHDRPPRRARRPHRDPGGHRHRRGREVGRLARRQGRHGRRRRAAGLRRGDAGTPRGSSTSAMRSRSRRSRRSAFCRSSRPSTSSTRSTMQISEFLEVSYLWYLPVLAWPTALFMIFATVGAHRADALARAAARSAAGTYSIFSGFYMRKWVVALATEVTLETLTSLYATIYMRAWYRLMGATIGKGAEISTNLAGRYDLTEIGAKNFIADEVVFGDEDVRRGWMHLEPVKTEDRGLRRQRRASCRRAPSSPRARSSASSRSRRRTTCMAPGDTWFGSPPIKLPTRQKVDIGATWTYEPSTLKKLWRGGVRGAPHLVPVDAVHHLRDPVDRQLLLSGGADPRLADAGRELRRGARSSSRCCRPSSSSR